MLRRLVQNNLLYTTLITLLLLGACQPQELEVADGNDSGHARAVVDALDKQTAQARKARISNIEYDAIIDIAASDTDLMGEVGIRFNLSDEAPTISSDLTLDFTGNKVKQVIVNGNQISPDYNGHFIVLPARALQLGENNVSVAYRSPFGRDGTGLHRFEDPEDGLVYLHSYLWPYYANRLLPVFDQPNLKANFSLRVVAPESWSVFSMNPGAVREHTDGTRLWTFTKTPKIASYMFSLHAGAYTIWTDDSGDVPLRLMARQSLAEYVAVDEWFKITHNGMKFYKDYFDIPYPFEKYDQLIVPEFNIGGMENAAAVSFTEAAVQRQPSDRAQRQRRADLVLHELAHMWFGDLVTHDWWNGMWLNESFATQMSAMAQDATTEFSNLWHSYFAVSKKDAFERDSRVTTHPIEMPVRSTDEFTSLFDAITYEKGGSALKQLQHRVGAENYREGVSAYLKEHSYGTTVLADFINHQARSAGIDLSRWSDEWLLTPGFNTLRVEASCKGDSLTSIAIVQSADEAHPQLRTHKVDLALFNFDANDRLVVAIAIPVLVEGKRTAVEIPAGQACPSLTNPNHNDWTYAKTALSNDDVALLKEHLKDITDPLSRSMFLAALFDKAMAGEMSIANYVRQALTLSATERNFIVLEQISVSLVESLNTMQRLRPETNKALDELLVEIEQVALTRSSQSESQDLKQLWLQTFLQIVASDQGLKSVQALLIGDEKLAGVEISPEIRWRLLTILSRHNVDGIESLLASEAQRDPSDFGQRSLLSAQAARPNAANKARWVDELQTPTQLKTLAKQRAVIQELFPATQTNLQLSLLEKVLNSLPQLSSDADPYFLSSYTQQLLTPMCRKESTQLMQTALGEYAEQLNPTALRFLREAHQADQACQSLRRFNK